MAIYHLEAKVVSRGNGRSACAASAYLSCSAILNEYDGVQHDYTRKKGLVWREVFLPEYAPQEWQDRAVLWNAVEENEKTKDSRLAREFVVALPIELTPEQWQALLADFVQNQFVADGMCADLAIHDPDPLGHNPHAHIMLTVRPLDEQGKWQHKTEKEYLCIKDGEERGFTAAEFKAAQTEGWEKQYQYKVGKKKVYLTPSAAEAQGCERVNKYPKSTKYGRQNPISERWNSEEQLLLWRKAWADVTNKYLERYGHEERIDHRSFAERGIDEQPTVHEGVAARAMEAKGIISDRCELNRQIKTDNKLLRELKAQVKKLADAVIQSIPAMAEAMEKLWKNMLIFAYQLTHIRRGKRQLGDILKVLKPDYEQHTELAGKIRDTKNKRKALLEEKKQTPVVRVLRHRELASKIAELTEQLEELQTEKNMLLKALRYDDDTTPTQMQKDIRRYEENMQKLSNSEVKYAAELEAALQEYAALQKQAADMDEVELYEARQVLRPEQEATAIRQIRAAYGNKYDSDIFYTGRREIAYKLDEYGEETSIMKKLRGKEMELRRKRQEQKQPKKQKDCGWDR